MSVILDAFSQLTPTVLFAVVALFLCLSFFVYYWYAITPRRGTLEWIAMSEAQPRRLTFTLKRHPMEKRDAIPLLIVTIAYACTAFFQLGDTTAVQSFARFEADTTASFSFAQPEEVSLAYYYTGIATGDYTLEYSVDGSTWESVELDQAYNTLLKWQVLEYEDEEEQTHPVTFTAQMFRLSASPRSDTSHPERNFLDLGELAFFNAEGEPIEVVYSDRTGEALFDEQDLVVDYPFYLNSSYFDEIYHVRTAQENLDGIYPYEVSHPPLGKLIIALGIQIFGLTPFGWRFMGTLFGVLMLPLLYVFLKNLFGRTAVATCGTVLFAVDFMHLVQTRIATIDTYGVFFILAMYYFMYRWLTIPPNVKLRRSIPSLFLCGLMWGIGVACKWTVIYGGVGLAVLWLIGLILKHREWDQTGASPRFVPFFWGTFFLSILFFIVVPLVIYVASYIPYAVADGDTSLSNLLRIVWDNQVFMLTYHQGVHDPHPYESRWYQWIVDGRPILYFREMDQIPGYKAAFSSFNNPIVSWCGLLCIIITAIQTFRRKCGKALFIFIGYLSQLVPWIFISRTTFAYHYFPSILFLVLAISYAMNHMMERRKGRYRFAVYGITATAVVLYAAFYPVLIGLYVPTWYTWNFLRWLPSWPI